MFTPEDYAILAQDWAQLQREWGEEALRCHPHVPAATGKEIDYIITDEVEPNRDLDIEFYLD